MWHQPRPARIGRRMCGSGKRRRPPACSNSQGLHASAVVRAHWLGVTGCGLRASANGWRHRPRPGHINRGVCAFGKRRRPTACNIGQGLHASAVAYAHRLEDIGCGLRASANGRGHRLRPTRINRGVCASSGRHRCCLRASARRPRPNGRQHQPRPARI